MRYISISEVVEIRRAAQQYIDRETNVNAGRVVAMSSNEPTTEFANMARTIIRLLDFIDEQARTAYAVGDKQPYRDFTDSQDERDLVDTGNTQLVDKVKDLHVAVEHLGKRTREAENKAAAARNRMTEAELRCTEAQNKADYWRKLAEQDQTVPYKRAFEKLVDAMNGIKEGLPKSE